jgi:hypothetical protein
VSLEELREKLGAIRDRAKRLDDSEWLSNKTYYFYLEESQKDIPALLDVVEDLLSACEKIGHTTDVSPVDPDGGPCRIATAMSRNRRILEAQEAISQAAERLCNEGREK